ncbi:hypothetical protein C823_007929 [Eubacterium plexicaudatum ASF492]|nr:hypothetical protein C823_007929 [Eubacterium plexicaudatum ASF492]
MIVEIAVVDDEKQKEHICALIEEQQPIAV